MGATNFRTVSFGKDAEEAFKNAVIEATNRYGNNGYTGTIAEKESYLMIYLPKGKNIDKQINDSENNHPMISDKYGPAGCIELTGINLSKAKLQNDLKGKRTKGFVFFGISCC